MGVKVLKYKSPCAWVGLSMHAQKLAHAQFKAGWGWFLQARVESTEQSYNSCVNGNNVYMNKHRYNSENKVKK